MDSRVTLCGVFVRFYILIIVISIFSGVSLSLVSVRLRVGCWGVWIVLKLYHSDHVTEHALYIIDIYRCAFEVFL